MNPIITFAEASIGAVAALLVGGIASVIVGLFALKKSVDTLVSNDVRQARAIEMIAGIQRPQLYAHKATLEALKGECNGNVDYAHAEIMIATKNYEAFLVEAIFVERKGTNR
jgi:hypothetical protein